MISTVRCALHSLDSQCDAHGLYMVSTDRLKLLLVFTRATKRLFSKLYVCEREQERCSMCFRT